MIADVTNQLMQQGITEVKPVPMARDPAKEQHDWFGQLVRELGAGHKFDPAAELLVQDDFKLTRPT